MFKIFAVTVLLGFAASAVHAQTATLTIDCANLQPKGAVLVALYDDAAGYTSDSNPRFSQAEVKDGRATITFDALPQGEYAFKMFQDVDGNGDMSFNPFGMPTEPYAFSNNAAANMGPATWEAARFTVTAPVTVQNIKF